jgi:GNAT superfamily N-acetyltransferase
MESCDVEIYLWDKRFKNDFIRLNREWIERYFVIEPSDEKIFNDPEGVIIDKGGMVFLAVMDGRVVGCCALVYHDDSCRYELAKMAVSPSAQGHGIGYKLGRSVLEYARLKGADEVFLEANTKLVASVKLYGKLGFKAVEKRDAVYSRCDLYMTCRL